MSDAENDQTSAAFDPTNRIKPQDAKGGDPGPDDSLLNMDPKAAAREMLKDWDDSWKDIKGIKEQWKANKARADGYTGVQMVKKQDHAEAYIPLGARKSIGGLNKANRLMRRITSNIFNDKPIAECTPAGDSDEQRDAAEFGTRILQYQCAEGQIDFALGAADAFRAGGIYGSGFMRFWVDENGGGYLPKQAQDPQTEQLRYVDAQGQFVDDRKLAARQWFPRLRREILTGKHVRFIPFQVRDIWEADGLMVGCVVPLKTIKDTFPDVAKWPADRLAKIASARPQNFKDLLPQGQKDDKQGEVKDTSMCFMLMRWHVQSPKYPEGAYIVAAGSDEILYRGEWFDKEHVRPLDIPLTQLKWFTEEDNPYGSGGMENMGPGNEIRDAMLLSELEHLDRFNKRKVFVSMVSPLAGNPQLMQMPTGTPIPIMPGTEPHYEEIPDFPVVVEKMLNFANLDMDDESGLQQQAQGLNSASVKSGTHAEAILETVKKGLTDLWDNTERGLVRGWRIMMQLDRAFMGQEQLLRFQGPDGAFKLDRWNGEDFGDTEDVQVKRGTFTGQSPEQKIQKAFMLAQMGMLKGQDVEHIAESGINPTLGLQQNPHRLRVRRQIAEWQDGPPEGWPAPPQLDPMTGQPIPAPDPLAAIWEQHPTDTQPDIAQMRMYEIGRALDGTSVKRWGPQWAQGIQQAYIQARQASQVMDAETSAKMQQELQGAKDKIAQQDAKLAEKPSISLALKPAFALDQPQVAAIMAQEGVVLPPGGVADQVMDPREELTAKTGIEREKIGADLKKHQMTLAAGSQEKEKSKHESAKTIAPNISLHMPASPGVKVEIPDLDSHRKEVAELHKHIDSLKGDIEKAKKRPRKFTVKRGAKGEVVGAEADGE